MDAGPRQGSKLKLYKKVNVNGVSFSCPPKSRLKTDNSTIMVRTTPTMQNRADSLYVATVRYFVDHTPPSPHDNRAEAQSLVFGHWYRPLQLSDSQIQCPVISTSEFHPAEGRFWLMDSVVPTNISLAPALMSDGRMTSDRQSVLHVDSDFLVRDYAGLGGWAV